METIAYAAQESVPPGGFASFIPLFMIMIPFAFLAFFIAKRKGKNPYLYFFFGLIPAVGPLIILYLASCTDKEVLDRLAELEGKVN